jgi:hypothetical protein
MMAATRVSDCLERTILPALFYRVAACQLECSTPLFALPATEVRFLFRDGISGSKSTENVYGTTKEKSFERFPSAFRIQAT